MPLVQRHKYIPRMRIGIVVAGFYPWLFVSNLTCLIVLFFGFGDIDVGLGECGTRMFNFSYLGLRAFSNHF